MSISGSGSQRVGYSARPSSTGNAGQITVSTPTLTMGDGGTISVATSGSGNAGNIVAECQQLYPDRWSSGGKQHERCWRWWDAGADGQRTRVHLRCGSGLFSTASSTGNAGQITVAAPGSTPVPTLTMADNGKISVATSLGVGSRKRGSISLNANNFSLTGGAQVVSSTSGSGQGGSVTATATRVHVHFWEEWEPTERVIQHGL